MAIKTHLLTKKLTVFGLTLDHTVVVSAVQQMPITYIEKVGFTLFSSIICGLLIITIRGFIEVKEGAAVLQGTANGDPNK